MHYENFIGKYQKTEVDEYPNSVSENNGKPTVSVILITYNHAGYIRQAIESVLIQKGQFTVEILIGDDESSDGTREICKEYAKKFPDRIRFFLHKRANNIKIQNSPTPLFQFIYNYCRAEGDYIAILSGDDYWTDEYKLQKQINYLRSNEGFVAVGMNYLVNREGKSIRTGYNPSYKRDEFKRGSIPKALTVLYKNLSEVQCSLPLFSAILTEDETLGALMKCYGRIGYINEVCGVYRIHDNSIYSSLAKVDKYKTTCSSLIKLRVTLELHEVCSTEKKSEVLRHLDNRITNCVYGLVLIMIGKGKLFEAYKFFNSKREYCTYSYFHYIYYELNSMLEKLMFRLRSITA